MDKISIITTIFNWKFERFVSIPFQITINLPSKLTEWRRQFLFSPHLAIAFTTGTLVYRFRIRSLPFKSIAKQQTKQQPTNHSQKSNLNIKSLNLNSRFGQSCLNNPNEQNYVNKSKLSFAFYSEHSISLNRNNNPHPTTWICLLSQANVTADNAEAHACLLTPKARPRAWFHRSHFAKRVCVDTIEFQLLSNKNQINKYS